MSAMATAMTMTSLPQQAGLVWKSVLLVRDRTHGYCLACGKKSALRLINSSTGESENIRVLLLQYGGIYAGDEGHICRLCRDNLFTINKKIKAFHEKCKETMKKHLYIGPKDNPDHSYSMTEALLAEKKQFITQRLMKISVLLSGKDDICGTSQSADTSIIETGQSADRNFSGIGQSADGNFSGTSQSADADQKIDHRDTSNTTASLSDNLPSANITRPTYQQDNLQSASTIVYQLDNLPSASTTFHMYQMDNKPPVIDSSSSLISDHPQYVKNYSTNLEPSDKTDNDEILSVGATAYPTAKRFQTILPKPGQISDMELLKRSGKKDVVKKGPSGWKCSICHVKFSGQKQREHHWKELHDQYFEMLELSAETSKECSVNSAQCSVDSAHVKPSVPQFRQFKCLICTDSKTYTGIEAVRKHLKGHIGLKLYPCKLCDKSYRIKASFDQHMLKHTGKKHLCPECGKLFLTKNCLREHNERIHLKCWKRSHKCETCGKCFDRFSKLQNHRSMHSTDRPHLCNICGKTFKLMIHLRVHYQKSHDQSPLKQQQLMKVVHECPACEGCFVSHETLMNHVTVTHEQQCLHCPAAILSYKDLADHREVCPERKPNEPVDCTHEGENVNIQATCIKQEEQDVLMDDDLSTRVVHVTSYGSLQNVLGLRQQTPI